MPGYGAAFVLLDTIVRQLSQDMVKDVAPSASIVDGIASTSPEQPWTAVSVGTVYLFAYLPSRRGAHKARLDLVERLAGHADGALAGAIASVRADLDAEAAKLRQGDFWLAGLAAGAGVALPAPDENENETLVWLAAVSDAVRPHLTTEALEAGWRAGEAARFVTTTAALVTTVARLGAASPADAEVRALAADLARHLETSTTTLRARLAAAGFPRANEVDTANLDELAYVLESIAPQLDGGPPPPPPKPEPKLSPEWKEERPGVFVQVIAPTPVASPLPATEAAEVPEGAELSPGTAYLLAYLMASRTTLAARLELLDQRGSASPDRALAKALASERVRCENEEQKIAATDARIGGLESKARLILRAPPKMQSGPLRLRWMTPPNELPEWLTAVADAVRPRLDTPVLEAAWRAGEAARLVAVSVALAATVGHLRCAAPDDADLRTQAGNFARALEESAATLRVQLEATGLPLVINFAGSVAEMVALTSPLEPTTTGGASQIDELARDLDGFLETKARHLDVAPPPPPSFPPTAEEEALLAQIIVMPSDRDLRLRLATLAESRNDPRGRFIRLQLSGGDDTRREAHDTMCSHPEWSARLVALGATNIKFGGGFPEEITIDAAVLLERSAELFAAAPLRRLHVRTAKGRVAEVVRSPLLATIETLDLDSQGVTDDDVVALAASPHAAGLRRLDLRYNPITERGIEALAASPQLGRLEMVNLDGNPADPVDRLEYYDETHQHAVPTEAGEALRKRYGPLRWLTRGVPDL
jgi:hypothetical protein